MGALLRFAIVGLAVPLAFASLAGLVAVMLPLRLKRATDCFSTVPVNAGILGLLTILAAVGVGWLWRASLALIVPFLFTPIVIMVALGLIVGLCFGWVVVSSVVGKIVLARFGIYTPPMVSVTVGAALLGMLLMFSTFIPCLAGMVWTLAVILSCAGLGAVILTRAGSRSYPAKTVRRIETL